MITESLLNEEETGKFSNVQYLQLALRWCTLCPVWQDKQSVFKYILADKVM